MKYEPWENMRTIAIDFDGVIHKYSKGWQNGEIYDKPVEGAINTIKQLQLKYKIVIFTVRDNFDDIRKWLTLNGIENLPEVTNKKPVAIAYIDDRGIRFTNWNDIINYF